ncbi:DinB family protein [Halobacillus salinus]|nr:DinB family protein [Halobacillus salinus]
MEFKVETIKGYTPHIGQLVTQMNYVRQTTLEAVAGLSTQELDFLPIENGNCIGALLLHIAAVEKGFQIEFFDGRSPNEEEELKWGAAYSLGQKGREEIKGAPLDFYLKELEEVRARTLEEFQSRDDNWLKDTCIWDGHEANQHFIWFHVLEDEINHRGQIRMIRKMLP